ncbi:MAG: hypothetical protein FWD24_06510 [Treponema sp.]|nr:hypothetical protein [Treponema sp.]
MKKTILTIILITSILLTGCNNFFHDLIPYDGDKIISFSISGQVDIEMSDNSIVISVPPGTPFNSVIPAITVSPGATILPITKDYVARAFDDERTFGAAMEIYTSGEMTDTVIEMIKANRTFNRPLIDIPIDFRFPVDFLVISGMGNVRRYTVRVIEDTGEGKFLSFRFDKFFNSDLVSNTTGSIDLPNKEITINVSYPVENIASYKLFPTFETNNARVYLNGNEVTSITTILDFLKPPTSGDLTNPVYGTQEKTLTLRRNNYPDSIWTLKVNFSEDPDTSRAITDFRFTRARNSLINADYMAEITNSGDTGTINVTVYYSGEKPEELRAEFISPAQTPPGTIIVNGGNQISGITYQDFSAPLLYVVTSRYGNLTRTYTVTVNLVPASDPLPVINSFSFSTIQNPLLSANSIAMIDHNARLIIIEAVYDGASPPFSLSPVFTATGNVSVNSISQTSGTSSQNFSGPIGYTVTNPSNPTLKRDYRVEVTFTKNLSDTAEITTFTFFAVDNPGLLNDTIATINQLTGEITATLLFDTPGGSRTLVPRWSAQGTIDVNGITQISGTGRQFYTPVTYRASAANGFNRTYTVRIKEVNSRIYVRQNATGRGDGTNWQNAYRNIPQAIDDAVLFPINILKEIWIAQGTYTPSNTNNIDDYLLITANTSYIGGFAGTENSISARTNMNSRRAMITGDLGGGRVSRTIFSAYYFDNSSPFQDRHHFYLTEINGDILFEYLDFSVINDTITTGANHRDRSGAIAANLSNDNTLSIFNCSFYNIQNNVAINLYNRNNSNPSDRKSFHLLIDNIDINESGWIVFNGGNSNSSVTIKNSNFKNMRNGIAASYPGNVTIENVKMENMRTGIAIYYLANGGTCRIYNCEFKDMGAIGISSSGSIIVSSSSVADVEISNITIENSRAHSSGSIRLICRNATISHVNINNSIADGLGSYTSSPIQYQTAFGGAISLECDNVIISDTVITNAKAFGPEFLRPGSSTTQSTGLGGGVYWVYTNSLTVINSRFENCTAYTAGGAIFPSLGSPGLTVTNTQFINCSPHP